MAKVAIIGANGQVGAELCLMLAARAEIELVPICRNRSGSAFLRWHGIACRHGRAADSLDAPRLFGDCDVIVNSSLANGTPAEIRRIEDQIVHNMFACSREAATVIHFSTQSVYGDPQSGRWIRWRNPYGRVKLASERQVRVEQRRYSKPSYIFRLGHVCGSLQEISNAIRASIRDRTVVLPSRDCSSNTVYTATIVGAVEQVLRGAAQPGTYDLMNSPRWTWREVYQYEADVCGVPFSPRVVDEAPPHSIRSALLASARQFVPSLASAQPMRDFVAKSFAHMPDKLNARAMAWWYAKRARSEIAALGDGIRPAAHLSWVTNGHRFFPADKPTIDLLRAGTRSPTNPGSGTSWPDDLPDAGATTIRA